MNRDKLKQYKALIKEIPKLEGDLEKYQKQLQELPTTHDKVTSSRAEHPFTPQKLTVYVDDPKEADRLNKLIRLKRLRLGTAKKVVLEVEEFIADIPDSTLRQIFQMAYVDGMKYHDIGKEVGYTKGRISQLISDCLKD